MRRVRRWPILLLVVGALVAAAVLQERGNEDASATRAVAVATEEPGVPPSDARSASWFCAAGTSTPDGRADETVIVSNIDDREITATVTVMPGGDAAPASRTLEIGARREVRLPVSEVLETPDPGVVVEVVGGQAAVAHEIRAADDLATEACTRRVSADWYFAGGTTVRGAEQYLALFDPFGDDAIVDVSFLTETGVQEPNQLQALVVGRRSVVNVAVHDLVPRQDLVGIHVHARSGRVVAERSMSFDGTPPDDAPTRRGVTLSLGAISPHRTWNLPFGIADDGGAARLGVANFGAVASEVEVEVLLPGNQTLPTQSLSIPARSVVALDVSDRVPADSTYAVRAFARTVEGHAAPLVVEMLSWWPEESTSTSVATTLGAPDAARRWVVAVPDAQADGVVTVVNPGAQPVTAELRVYGADGGEPASAPAVAIERGRFATFALGSLGVPRDRVMAVVADRPVVVGFTVIGDAGGAMMLAVPDFGFGVPD